MLQGSLHPRWHYYPQKNHVQMRVWISVHIECAFIQLGRLAPPSRRSFSGRCRIGIFGRQPKEKHYLFSIPEIWEVVRRVRVGGLSPVARPKEEKDSRCRLPVSPLLFPPSIVSPDLPSHLPRLIAFLSSWPEEQMALAGQGWC